MKSHENGNGESANKSDREGSVLAPFWKLADSEKVTRIEAVKELVEIPSVQSVGSSNHDYAIKRLARGLLSSRGMARQGFVLALTQLLRACPEIDVLTTANLVVKTTESSGSMRGIESREYYFGRLFGFLALVRSGRCNGNADALSVIVEKSLVIAQTKPWIEQLALEVVCEAFHAAVSGDKDSDKILMKLIGCFKEYPKNAKAYGDLTAGQFGLACCVNQTLAGKPKLIRILESTSIALLLPENDDSELRLLWENASAPMKDACKESPRTHSMWKKLLEFFILTKPSTKKPLVDLWSLICDTLIGSGASHEKKFTSLKVFQEAVNLFKEHGLVDDLLMELFTPEFCHFVFGSVRKKNDVLHPAALSALKHVGKVLQSGDYSSVVRASLYRAMDDGCVAANLAHEIVYGGDESGLGVDRISKELSYLKDCGRQFFNSGGKTTWNPMHIYSLLKPIKDKKIRSKLGTDVAEFLCEVACFDTIKVKESKTQKVSNEEQKSLDEAREKCLHVLFCLLSENALLEEQSIRDPTRRYENQNTEINSTEVPALGTSIRRLNATVSGFIANDDYSLIADVSSDTLALREKAIEFSEKIWKSDDKETNESRLKQSLAFFLQHLAFQTLVIGSDHENGEINVDLGEVIGDLIRCVEKIGEKHQFFSTRKLDTKRRRKSKSLKQEPSKDLDEPNPVAVLVDCMMAILAQPSSLLRNIVTSVFRSSIFLLDPDALDVVFDVLLTSHTSAVLDKSNSEMNAASDDEELNSDMEVEEEDHEDEDEDEDEEELSDDDSDKEQDEVDGELADRALEAFVKASLDRNNMKKKGVQRKLEIERINVKMRAMELIEIFLKSKEAPLELKLLVPLCLIQAADLCFIRGGTVKKGAHGDSSQSLFDRISKVLSAFVAQRKKLTLSADPPKIVLSSEGWCLRTLNTLNSEKSLECYTVDVKALLAALVRCGLGNAKRSANSKSQILSVQTAELGWNLGEKLLSVDEIVTAYRDLAEDYATNKKTKLKSRVFEAPLKRVQHNAELAWRVACDLCEFSAKSTKLAVRLELFKQICIVLQQGNGQSNHSKEGIIEIIHAICDYFVTAASGESEKKQKMLKSASLRPALKLLKDTCKFFEKQFSDDKDFKKSFNSAISKGNLSSNLALLTTKEFHEFVAPNQRSDIAKVIEQIL